MILTQAYNHNFKEPKKVDTKKCTMYLIRLNKIVTIQFSQKFTYLGKKQNQISVTMAIYCTNIYINSKATKKLYKDMQSELINHIFNQHSNTFMENNLCLANVKN